MEVVTVLKGEPGPGACAYTSSLHSSSSYSIQDDPIFEALTYKRFTVIAAIRRTTLPKSPLIRARRDWIDRCVMLLFTERSEHSLGQTMEGRNFADGVFRGEVEVCCSLPCPVSSSNNQFWAGSTTALCPGGDRDGTGRSQSLRRSGELRNQ